MRELKFRAWDTRGQIGMIEDPDLSVVLDDKRYIVEQFTGLKDKNGREIYEGDIIRKHGAYPEDETDGGIGEVIYDEQWMRFVIKERKAKRWTFNGPEGVEWLPDNLEVIGNIHENKELLGDGK